MSFSLLIVEDNPEEAGLLRIVLNRYFPQWKFGFVRNLNDLTDALLTASAASLILLDMDLPTRHRLTFFSKIRELKSHANLPVAGYSYASSPAMVQAFLDNGGDHFFEKTYDLDQLLGQFRQLPSVRILKQAG